MSVPILCLLNRWRYLVFPPVEVQVEAGDVELEGMGNIIQSGGLGKS